MDPLPLAHVLVADDELLIRAFVTRVLEGAGYRVTAVDDGAPALAALLAEGADFAALVTDCRMTHVNGPEVLARLRAAGRSVPVILTSGSEHPDSISGLAGDPRTAFLVKPFQPVDLLASLQRLLTTG
jgi:CheY-like chemotaxis protein